MTLLFDGTGALEWGVKGRRAATAGLVARGFSDDEIAGILAVWRAEVAELFTSADLSFLVGLSQQELHMDPFFSLLDLFIASRLFKIMLYRVRADATLGLE